MKINDVLHGFKVQEIHELSEIKSTLYKFIYEKTNTECIWIDSNEENKLFSITFKTLPSDDTGVFHILEHSVLNGSKKYPVREPFVELLKSSMNTFLNAMTFPDKTMYPVSSRNSQDFLNLVNVYLDAVFHPLIYSNPNIFYQEGWHYELNNEEETPIYKGVVFNEMKGAFSSVDTKMSSELERLIYPNNCYQYVSGGDPKSIPNLSYEKFIQTHQEYYHPSNSKIYLDGNIPLDETLQLLDEYLSNYELSTKKHEILLQDMIKPTSKTSYYEIGEDEELENKVQIGLGKIVCDYKDRMTQMSHMILSNYLTGSNESILKKSILQKGLAQDIYISINDNIAQPYCSIQIKNTELNKKEEIKNQIKQTIQELKTNGLNKEELEAILNEFEFQILEMHEPKGLIRNINMMSSWLYDGDPLLYLENKEIMKQLRENIQTNVYENLLDFYLDDFHEVVLLPSKTIGQEEVLEENNKCVKAKNNWTQEELNQVLTLNKKLLEWQQQADTIENLNTLPKLSLNQITPKMESLETKEIDMNGFKVLYHPISEAGITYMNFYFTLADRKLHELSALSFLTNLLGELPTKNYSVEALQREIKKTIGFIDYNIQTFKSDLLNECKPMFVLSCSVLDDKVEDALNLICEILNETIYDSEESKTIIWDVLMQAVESVRQAIIGNGHRYALRRTLKNFNAETYVEEETVGYDMYEWLVDFSNNYQEKISDYLSLMKDVQRNTFDLDHLTTSITSSTIPTLHLNLKNNHQVIDHIMKIELEDKPVKEIIKLPMNISYACLGTNLKKHDLSYNGTLRVLSSILTYDYLWNEIRVQGGAYGCGFQVSSNGNIGFYSYRDPSPLRSQDIYKKASEYIKSFCEQTSSIDNYIISTLASLEPLLTSRQKGSNEDYYYFTNTSLEKRNQIIQEILSTTKDDLYKCVDILEKIASDDSMCIVGNIDDKDWSTYKL